MFTLISYQEATSGFYENDWQIIRKISSPKDFLEALKEGYLKDASTRSLYPINGFDIKYIYLKRNLSKYEGETFLGGSYNDNSFEPDNPDFRYEVSDTELLYFIKNNKEYNNCYFKFEKWKAKIKTLIPRIRELKRIEDKKNNDIKILFKLAEQYGYDLLKK